MERLVHLVSASLHPQGCSTRRTVPVTRFSDCSVVFVLCTAAVFTARLCVTRSSRRSRRHPSFFHRIHAAWKQRRMAAIATLTPKARRWWVGQMAAVRAAPAPCMRQFASRPDPVVTADSTSAAARLFSCTGAARRSGPSKTSSSFAPQFALSGRLIRAAWPVSFPTRHVAGWPSTWWTGAGRAPGSRCPRHRDHPPDETLLCPTPRCYPSPTTAKSRSSRSLRPSFRAGMSGRAHGPIAGAWKTTYPVRSSAGVLVPGGRRGGQWCWMPTRRLPSPPPPTAARPRMGRCFAAGAYPALVPRRRAVRRTRALVLPRTVSATQTRA